MVRIGEAAKIFNISNRTLRHWEEKGILKSVRMENGYRYYDDENSIRIKQIVLLRRMKIPIGDIEKILISNDIDKAINILTTCLLNLRNERKLLDLVEASVEKLIFNLQQEKSLGSLFLYLEKQETSIFADNISSQILFFERNMSMQVNGLNDVRTVRLPPMTVASYRAESETPEMDCSKAVNRFISENSLHQKSTFRHFGFNNPNPSENNPVYGYEIWIAVPDDFQVPSPFIKRQFEGGLYASISSKISEIGERWLMLYNWVKGSEKYAEDMDRQCLEECVDYETFISAAEGEIQLDLLSPIKAI